MSNQKQLYSLSSERSVIGSLLINPETWEVVSEALIESDFFVPEHQMIFSAISSLCDDSEPFDVVTTGERLNLRGQLDDVGGMVYLIEVCESTPSTSNAGSYAGIVKEYALLRALDKMALELRHNAHNREGITASDLLEESERALSQLGDSQQKKGGFRDAKSVLNSTVERIEERGDSEGKMSGLSTGITDLDDMTNGLQKKDLIILGARPSLGKTGLMMRFAEEAAFNSDLPVLVYSLEMPAEDIMRRTLSSVGKISQSTLMSGDLSQNDWDKLIMAAGKLKNSKLMIDDTSGISPSEMRSRARKIHREHGGVSMILVDYLQLMKIKGFKGDRGQEISEISRSLKALAKELDCPVVALSQLNRSLENRPDKRPVNSDLRESGAIEQDADLIMFLYRDEVYHNDSPDKGIAEIIIGKQRNGPIGTCRAAFLGQYTRFENLAKGYNDY